MELGKFGTKTNGDGSQSYFAWDNPLLIPGVKGFNPLGYNATIMNPTTFAKPEAAYAIAKALGGEVVQDPMTKNWNVSEKALAVKLTVKTTDGDGNDVEQEVVANAGFIANVMGDDLNYRDALGKSIVICTQVLKSNVDAGLAEKLWQALKPLALK